MVDGRPHMHQESSVRRQIVDWHLMQCAGFEVSGKPISVAIDPAGRSLLGLSARLVVSEVHRKADLALSDDYSLSRG